MDLHSMVFVLQLLEDHLLPLLVLLIQFIVPGGPRMDGKHELSSFEAPKASLLTDEPLEGLLGDILENGSRFDQDLRETNFEVPVQRVFPHLGEISARDQSQLRVFGVDNRPNQRLQRVLVKLMLEQNVTHFAHCFDVEIIGLVELMVPQDDLSIQDDHD